MLSAVSHRRHRGCRATPSTTRRSCGSPAWRPGPDDDVEVALRARRRLIGELVDSGRVLAPPHFDERFGRLVSEAPAGGVGWLPLA